MPVVEFNRDIFLCNNLDNSEIPSNNICSEYNTETECDPNDLQNCLVCQNMQYRDWYNTQIIDSEGNYNDTKERYYRAWLQTWNLGIGITFLLIGIFYQL
jgi:hypothetical protein